jgi:hypothetical protein
MSNVRMLGCLNAAVLIACQPDTSDLGTQVTVRWEIRQTGTVYATHVFPERIEPSRVMVEDLRIGSVEGPDEDVFGMVLGMAVDSLGSIYIADRMSQEIRVFDSSGRFMFRFGGSGSGPGEFRSVRGLRWSPSGTLWAADRRNNRYSEFTAAGEFLRSYNVPPLRFRRSFWLGGIDRQGRVYNEALSFREDRSVTAFIRRFDPSSGAMDSVLLAHHVEAYETAIRIPRGSMLMPFSPKLYWALGPDGAIWSTRTDEYIIRRMTFQGDTTLVIDVRAPRLEVTEEELAGALAHLDVTMESLNRYTTIDPGTIPKVHPYTDYIDLDDQERLWVRRVTHSDSTVFDVFGRDGRYLWTVATPWQIAKLWPVLIVDNTMYAVVRDLLDVDYVVRGRLKERG